MCIQASTADGAAAAATVDADDIISGMEGDACYSDERRIKEVASESRSDDATETDVWRPLRVDAELDESAHEEAHLGSLQHRPHFHHVLLRRRR